MKVGVAAVRERPEFVEEFDREEGVECGFHRAVPAEVPVLC